MPAVERRRYADNIVRDRGRFVLFTITHHGMPVGIVELTRADISAAARIARAVLRPSPRNTPPIRATGCHVEIPTPAAPRSSRSEEERLPISRNRGLLIKKLSVDLGTKNHGGLHGDSLSRRVATQMF